ncbi:unannotated protein [freshwater metagenome]|uniref:Unannotated protein n=1 Tax=freshwater metagenome TaxID=449393 RepID=A0A6J6S6S1_9ZZZZ
MASEVSESVLSLSMTWSLCAWSALNLKIHLSAYW